MSCKSFNQFLIGCLQLPPVWLWIILNVYHFVFLQGHLKGRLCRRRIRGWGESPIFKNWWIFQATFHRDPTNLNSHQQCVRVPIWPTQWHLVIGHFFQSYAWKAVSWHNANLCVLWGWASFQIFSQFVVTFLWTRRLDMRHRTREECCGTRHTNI